jgi:hypothetical protein
MRQLSIVILISTLALPVVSQTASPKYEPGMILAVKPHHANPGQDSSARLYDISVRVGNTIYVVLYSQPAGTTSPEYRRGLDLPVLVGRNTIKFNDMLGRPRELPILSRQPIPDTKHSTALVS